MPKRAFRIILAIFVLANVLTVPTANAEIQSYFVGDKGPSGGTIAYVDEYDKFSWDYIEAAPASWMGEKSTESIRWSPFGSSASALTGLGSAIGDGAKNTNDILNAFGNGWGIKSAVRDVNNCTAVSGVKFCNVTVTLDTNHRLTRFDTSLSPFMPIFCDGVFLDSFYTSLTGEMKVVDAKSFSFVENGYQLKLADQINSKTNCKISYAAEIASSAKIAGTTGWVLPSYDELAQVQRAVGTNNQSPYVIDQSILTKNGYTGGYYSTSSLRDSSTQRVWGFTNATVAGKGGTINLLYGAPVIPIRYFKTTVPVRNKDIVSEEIAKPGPTEINAQILQTDANWYAKGSPFKVRGSIQIPANVTLKIHAGAVVDFTEANVTLLGKIIIGSNSSPLVTKVSLGSDFISKGNSGQLTIENAEIIGRGGVINQWDTSLSSLSIDNSTISKFRYLADRNVSKVSISNSLIRDMDAVTSEFSTIYDFSLTNNVLYELKSFTTPSKGVFVNLGQGGPTQTVSGNIVLNSVNVLKFTIPNSTDASIKSVFENNRFESPKLLFISGGPKAGGNYWNATDEANLRTLAKVSDGKSDITLSVISFTPFLTNAPAAPSKYQVLIDLLTVERRAASDLRAKQEADAKAAADLRAKQEADAKAAATKVLTDAKATAAKKTTITCVKGKLVKKVTSIKPVCPKGYKKK